MSTGISKIVDLRAQIQARRRKVTTFKTFGQPAAAAEEAAAVVQHHQQMVDHLQFLVSLEHLALMEAQAVHERLARTVEELQCAS
jgi:hypothetical protein